MKNKSCGRGSGLDRKQWLYKIWPWAVRLAQSHHRTITVKKKVKQKTLLREYFVLLLKLMFNKKCCGD